MVAALGIVLATGCDYPLGIGRAFLDGEWAYEAATVSGATLDCSVAGLLQGLSMIGGPSSSVKEAALISFGVAALFGLLLATSLAVGLMSRADPSPWPLVAMIAIDALIVLVAAGLRWRKLLFLFKLHPIDTLRGLEILATSVAFILVMSVYFKFLQRLGVPFSQATETLAQAGWPLWSMLVLVSLMPAIIEELAFRGVIQSSLERIFNARDAWLIQAALFSLLHLSPIVFPSHFVMGLCFGLIRMRSRSLYPSILLHAAWNALVVFQELGV